MESEKIYYATIILICAVSMLLSPFFYVSRTSSKHAIHRRPARWGMIILSNFVMIAALVWIWWKWF